MVPCCFPGNRILQRERIDVPEGYLTWHSQIRDALPLERSWLDSDIVDQVAISTTLTAVVVDKITTKGPLQ
jgi:hypothetical protein